MKDMTMGKPARIIGGFALPMLLGDVFQQLYSIVDSVVVGRFVGADALAAVGGSFPVTFILNAVMIGLTIGASVLLSQLFGGRNMEEFHRALYTMIIGMGVLAVILTGVSQGLAVPLLRLIGTPDHIMAGSTLYLRIVFGGLVLTFAYNVCTAIFRSIGDSKTPLYFLIIASILNIVLDLLFVVVFHMGIAGVAVATIMAQGISALLCVLYIRRKAKILKMSREERVFDRQMLKRILKLGIPAMFQQVSVSVSVMCVQGMVNLFGTAAMAGYAAAGKVESLAMMPMFDLGSALSTFVAQNIGAGDEKRARQGVHAGFGLAAAVCGGIGLLIFIFRYQLIGIFLKGDVDPLVVEFGVGYLGAIALFYLINAFYNNLSGALRGAGDAFYSMAATIIALVVRVASSYLMLKYTDLGMASIWWGLPISWSTGLVLCFIRYISGKWKTKV